jgi:hypothetical protein
MPLLGDFLILGEGLQVETPLTSWNKGGLRLYSNYKTKEGEGRLGLTELVPEPDNEFDNEAVLAVCEGLPIGYVPRRRSESGWAAGRRNIWKQQLFEYLVSGKPYRVFVRED